jgi:hypothetical protein
MQSLKRKNSHPIWNHFIVNYDKTEIKCDLCNQKYNFKTSITMLKKHFEKYHNEEYKLLEKQYELRLKKGNNSVLKQTKEPKATQQEANQEQTQYDKQTKITDFISKTQNINNIDKVNEDNNILSKYITIDSGSKKQKFQISSEDMTYNITAKKIKIIYE